jgi:hypothetical protein
MCVSAGSGLDPESDALDVVDAYVGAFGNSCATWTAAGGAEITQNVLLVVDYSNTYWPSLYYPNKYKGYYFNGFLALFGPPADTGPPGGFTGCNASFGDPSAVPGLSGAEAFPLSNTSNDPYLRTECDDGSLAAYGIPYTSASAPVNTQTPPTISGTTTQGDVLTAATGSWTNAPSSYSYQWQDCTLTNGNLPATGCTNVASGGTSSTYTLAAGDVGHYVVVNVTAINGGGASSPIPSFAAGSPTIIAS